MWPLKPPRLVACQKIKTRPQAHSLIALCGIPWRELRQPSFVLLVNLRRGTRTAQSRPRRILGTDGLYQNLFGGSRQKSSLFPPLQSRNHAKTCIPVVEFTGFNTLSPRRRLLVDCNLVSCPLLGAQLNAGPSTRAGKSARMEKIAGTSR